MLYSNCGRQTDFPLRPQLHCMVLTPAQNNSRKLLKELRIDHPATRRACAKWFVSRSSVKAAHVAAAAGNLSQLQTLRRRLLEEGLSADVVATICAGKVVRTALVKSELMHRASGEDKVSTIESGAMDSGGAPPDATARPDVVTFSDSGTDAAQTPGSHAADASRADASCKKRRLSECEDAIAAAKTAGADEEGAHPSLPCTTRPCAGPGQCILFLCKACLSIKQPLTAHGPIHPPVSSRHDSAFSPWHGQLH